MKPLTDNLQYYIETELILDGEKAKCVAQEYNQVSPDRLLDRASTTWDQYILSAALARR